MNTTITSRLELLLAKIAGQNVSLSTMTPPVASSLVEKLLLDIADRLDGIASPSAATTEKAGLMSADDKTKLNGIAAGAQVNPGAATTEATGVVKMAANVAEAAGSAPTAAEFKALLDALIAAGIMAAPAASGSGSGDN